ncbi:MAG: hypothetical protein GWP09_00335 [Nitrospiraceae bacterium]|nr:hypothetical protein [Nitrospiraceae bacterium]
MISLTLIISLIALLLSIISIIYVILYKRKVDELIREKESKKHKTLFDSISSESEDMVEKVDEAEAIELAKMMKEAIALKLKIKPTVTYPRLLEELEKVPMPSDLKKEVTDFFNKIMEIEYSNKWTTDDLESIRKDAKEIIKKLKLRQPTKE